VSHSNISRRELLASATLATLSAATGCRQPKAPRFLGYCFVANRDGHSIGVIDLSRFRLRRQLALDAAPEQMLAHPKASKAYALAPQNGTIYEIDGDTQTITRRTRGGNTATVMRIDRNGNCLWVLYRDPASLVEIPFDSLQPGRRIRLNTPPEDFDLSLAADEACVVSRRERTISVVSLGQGTITRTINAATEPSIARFRKDGKQIIAGSEADRSITIYDTVLAKAVVRLPISVAPLHFCVDSEGGQLYVTGDGMDAVVTVYPYRTEVAETRLAGRAPGAMVVTDTNPSYLMLTNPQTDGVTVLDVYSGKLTAVIGVGRGPCAIVITPDREYALVLNQISGDMAVIWLRELTGNQVGGVRVKRYKTAPLFTMIPVGQGPVSAAVVKLT
jgi:DNA-binding beta-propeller fold protein YncE